MRISTRARYALRASLALAKMEETNNVISINSLSEAEGISPVFIEQIFFKLRNAGILRSVRGPDGGFCFSQPLNELSVKTLLEAAGENFTLSFCDRTQEDCSKLGFCIAHSVWNEANTMFIDYLNKTTIASLLEKGAAGPGKTCAQ